jgi:Peptidase MA superfamily
VSASSQRLALRRLSLAALILILLGCSAPAIAPAPAPLETKSAARESSRLGLVRATVDALLKAALTGDSARFDRLISDQDPAFPDRARLLFDNLSTLPLTRLQMRMEPTEFVLSDARRRLLGPRAWVQRGVVTWRLAGDSAEVEHVVSLTFLEAAGEVKVAGTFDEPSGTVREQKPSWWLGPLTAREQDGVTLLAGSGQSVDRWINLAGTALVNVRQGLPDGLGTSWNRHVVIEVPATERDFASVLGKPGDSYASIAAVTHRAATAGDAIRIVVNPKTAQLTPIAAQSVLEHEMVHVATRSPDSPAPTWAEEGLAEWVTMQAHPGERSEAADEVLARVRSDGAPRTFPSDQQFKVDARNLEVAYAEAWLACRFIADQYSQAQLGRFYAELARGSSVDEASRDALQLSEAALVARWQAYLVRLAQY